MKIISVRKEPSYLNVAIPYFQRHWATDESMMLYEDSITASLNAPTALPQGYLLYQEESVIGCTGLTTHDFISRMDLFPSLCALYIEESKRGNGYDKQLIEHIKQMLIISTLNLSTDHIGYYEKYGFSYLADRYHPWGESSHIYQCQLDPK